MVMPILISINAVTDGKSAAAGAGAGALARLRGEFLQASQRGQQIYV